MSDIVERLRVSATAYHSPTKELAVEAADEIERLRDALEKIYDMANHWDDDWDKMKKIIRAVKPLAASIQRR